MKRTKPAQAMELRAIFKIENGTLTLAGISASAVQSPRPLGQDPGFENNSMFRYDLRKVQPKKKVPQEPNGWHGESVVLRTTRCAVLTGRHARRKRLA